MTLQTFDFPNHMVAEQYPETGNTMQFGRSYTFNTAPDAPPARIFTLTMRGMKVYTDENGNFDLVTNASTGKKNNMKTLYAFWQAHLRHVSFNYDHPFHGLVVVRFNTPFAMPAPIEGGTGVYPDFTIQLVERP